MRWKAERWMKVRHMPAAFRHDPRFVLRNGPENAGAHVPRKRRGDRCAGSSRRVRCSRGIARSVRRSAIYLDWPDPAPMADEGPGSGPCVSAIPLRA